MCHTRMLSPLLLLCLLLTLLPIPAAASNTSKPLAELELRQLDGLKSLFKRLHQRAEKRLKNGALSPALLGEANGYDRLASRYSTHQQKKLRAEYSQLVAQWQQFQIVAAHVLGGKAPSYASTHDAFIQGKSVPVSVVAATRAKDRFVERMQMLGYSAQEITDVISGRITLRALQKSDRMRVLGYASQTISTYLERHYTVQQEGTSHIKQARNSPSSTPQQLDQFVVRHARRHGLDPNLVRAVIANESSWRVDARSAVGAIGLMQLMPTTAQMLGVDPRKPEQNIEGGVRYLAGLVDMFEGDLDAALVSYNAGPTHARKWRKGDAVLYGETRNYLQRVKQSYAKLKM